MLLTAAFAALTLGAATFDNPFEDLGPEIGSAIPHNLDLVDQTGNTRDLKDLTGEQGLILMFNRSLDWCPFCVAQTLAINEVRADFEEIGFNIAVLTYDPVDELTMFAKERDIEITLLSDPDSVAIDAFGLRNEDYASNPRVYGVPHPVVFVVSPTGEIEGKLYEESYRDRPANEAVLELTNAAVAAR